jgi:hypothetical protein
VQISACNLKISKENAVKFAGLNPDGVTGILFTLFLLPHYGIGLNLVETETSTRNM